MIPLHSVLPDLAQREVRCLHIGAGAIVPAGEYGYWECYCDDLDCDCRRVFIEVVEAAQPGTVLASINYGWEKESFYRKRLPWDPNAGREIVRGVLDPINRQSEYAGALLDAFQRFVLDEPYRLRLRRHHRMFREELARRARADEGPGPPLPTAERRSS